MTSRLAFFLLQKTSHSFWKALSIIGCTAWMRPEVARFGRHILWRDVLSRTRLVIIETSSSCVYIRIYILYIFVYDKLYPLVLLYVFLVASCEYTHYSGIHHGTLSCYTLPGLFPLLLADHPHSCWDMCYMIYIHISY
jgi:hypothetical protein